MLASVPTYRRKVSLRWITLRHEPTIGPRDDSSALHGKPDRVQSVPHDEVAVRLPDPRRDAIVGYRVLVGPVGDADPAAEIDQLHPNPEALRDLDRQLEHEPSRLHEVRRVELVRRDHGVQSEPGGPFRLETGVPG